MENNIANPPKCGHPSKFPLRSCHTMLREIQKHVRATSQTLNTSLSLLDDKVHDRKVRKRVWLFENLFCLKSTSITGVNKTVSEQTKRLLEMSR